MSIVQELFSHSLAGHFYRQFQTWYRFKFVLPKIQELTLEGLRFDVSALSPKIRNRLQSGAYEAHEKQMCLEYVHSSDVVLELGGAIGFIGLICQKKVGVSRFFTVEANPATLAILQRNYRLNGLEPACWNLAVADASGPVELDVGTDFWENSIVVPSDERPHQRTVRVPGATLAEILKKVEPPVTVLIIDIEGAEQFLHLDEIPDSVRLIIIELHPAVIGQEKTYDFVAALIDRGFRVLREESGTFAFQRRSLSLEDGRPKFLKREADARASTVTAQHEPLTDPAPI